MQDEIPETGDILSSETESESDSEEDVKLSSSPNIITVSCCENVADISIQIDTCKPVMTCCCDKVLQKLEEVLDGLNHLQDELCTQSCDLMDICNRCLLIEKQVDCMEQHAHVSYLIGQHINVMILCTFLHVHLQSSRSSGTIQPLPSSFDHSQVTTPVSQQEQLTQQPTSSTCTCIIQNILLCSLARNF